jgi:hypothetical protein
MKRTDKMEKIEKNLFANIEKLGLTDSPYNLYVKFIAVQGNP